MIYLLDAGHGGMIGGVYQTPGKRSPVWEDMPQLFEGVFNREIVTMLHNALGESGISSIVMVPEQKDVSLYERVIRVNALSAKTKVILLSMHANAGGGTGWEAWTSIGDTKSDHLATYFYDEMQLQFPNERMRTDLSDGDKDKEENFYILKNTHCPAILFENFFMDNRHDCQLMQSKEGKQKIIKAYVNAINNIENSVEAH